MYLHAYDADLMTFVCLAIIVDKLVNELEPDAPHLDLLCVAHHYGLLLHTQSCLRCSQWVSTRSRRQTMRPTHCAPTAVYGALVGVGACL